MKKLLLLGTLFVINGLVHATTINAPSSLIGFDALNIDDAYSWGISISVPSGEEVASAEVNFTSVELNMFTRSGKGYFYADLLNSKSTGVTSAFDDDAPGDYWATKFSGANITPLGTETFNSIGTTLTWSYVLTSAELTSLNTYLADNNGIFNLGMTPDCGYSIGGLSFTYTLGSHHNTVPDFATTAFLLIMGLAGLEVFRRQFVAAKIKA
jgi:hypothetical protein